MGKRLPKCFMWTTIKPAAADYFYYGGTKFTPITVVGDTIPRHLDFNRQRLATSVGWEESDNYIVNEVGGVYNLGVITLDGLDELWIANLVTTGPWPWERTFSPGGGEGVYSEMLFKVGCMRGSLQF